MDTMSLRFSNAAEPFLSKTEYTIHATATKLIAVRGKTSAAFGAVGTFQWTSAVQAMAVLMIRTALSGDSDAPQEEVPSIAGDKGTLAASLDYCISKSPLWLLDMFGTDSRGVSRTRRLFLRNNPERKRGGEVTIAVNQHVLEPKNISFFLEGKEVTEVAQLRRLADQIERSCVYLRRDPKGAENVSFREAA